MAITTNASYVPTLNEFIGHWQDVDTERGAAGPLILSTGQGVAALSAFKTELQTVELALQTNLNDQQIARGGIKSKKAALVYWFGRFMDVFDGYFGSSDWAEARPTVLSATQSTENFLRPMLDVNDLWERIDNLLDTPEAPAGLALPLVLTGETEADTLSLEDFWPLIALLRTHSDDETIAAGRAKRTRSKRNAVQKRAYEAMKLYRKTMPGALPSGDALQGSLPRLNPADTGSTPDAVNASAVYVSGSQSKTVYDESAAADLKEYQLRGVIGEDWDEDDAVTIATNLPADAREFTVDFGLTQPETTIVLKVYVVTTTGRERGSAPIVVQRPAET